MGSVKLLTYRQVATFYGVTPRTVWNWADQGSITVVRTPGGHPRIPSDACAAPVEKIKRKQAETD